MKLYYTKGACSLATRIIVNEVGLPCEYESVDLASKKTETGQDFYTINPKGAVPTLITNNDETLTEIADNINHNPIYTLMKRDIITLNTLITLTPNIMKEIKNINMFVDNDQLIQLVKKAMGSLQETPKKAGVEKSSTLLTQTSSTHFTQRNKAPDLTAEAIRNNDSLGIKM